MNTLHTLLLLALCSLGMNTAANDDEANWGLSTLTHSLTVFIEAEEGRRKLHSIDMDDYIAFQGHLAALEAMYLERRRLTTPPKQRNLCEQRIIHKLLNGPKIRLALLLHNELQHPTAAPKNGLRAITRAINKTLASCHPS